MKIGTITFHWGTNYGAVLQAYALQKHLKNNGYDTEIIDYKPLRVRAFDMLWIFVRRNFKDLVKLKKFNSFRKKYLTLSKRSYPNNKTLRKYCHDYDTYITGSDQVWNVSFARHAENKPTLSYYLDFVREDKKRISYAVSFGIDKLPPDVIFTAKPELAKFCAISVREQTGKQIVNDMGFFAEITLDPTLLLDAKDYQPLISECHPKNSYSLFSYILHENQTFAHELKDYIYGKYFDAATDKKYEGQPISINEWLCNIKNSKLVLTNSFHGAIFSILFEKNFIVVPVEGSQMNDRIKTLLERVGLTDRYSDSMDEEKIDRQIKQDINWQAVKSRLDEYKKQSESFLKKSL